MLFVNIFRFHLKSVISRRQIRVLHITFRGPVRPVSFKRYDPVGVLQILETIEKGCSETNFYRLFYVDHQVSSVESIVMNYRIFADLNINGSENDPEVIIDQKSFSRVVKDKSFCGSNKHIIFINSSCMK